MLVGSLQTPVFQNEPQWFMNESFVLLDLGQSPWIASDLSPQGLFVSSCIIYYVPVRDLFASLVGPHPGP